MASNTLYKNTVFDIKKTSPPLSKAELQAIQERRCNDPDAMALLWEVSRLRTSVPYPDHFERTLAPSDGSVGMVRDMVRKKLDDEPCV